jgi:hypothetical protein
MLHEPEFRLAEKALALFEPDAVLPVQYFETLRRTIPIEPEKLLMWAILEDAIESYQKHFFPRRGKPNGKLAELESWLFDRDNDSLFSFDNVCETLAIDPQYLRGGLLRWKERQLAARPALKMVQAPAPKRKKAA